MGGPPVVGGVHVKLAVVPLNVAARFWGAPGGVGTNGTLTVAGRRLRASADARWSPAPTRGTSRLARSRCKVVTLPTGSVATTGPPGVSRTTRV